MCKIMIVPSVKPDKSEQLLKFSKASVKYLTAGDPHGFGYAAISNNQLTGECWLNPKDAFKPSGAELQALDDKLLHNIGSAVEEYDNRKEKHYRSHGDVDRNKMTTVLLHARYATCEKNIKNTHPFFRNNTALIHNGVIHNTYDLVNKTSTCDSECILNQYVDRNLPMFPKRVQEMADSLAGWYAVGIITKIQDRWYVDVFKEHSASLICAQVKELDAIVYCTNESILRKTVRACNFTMGKVFTCKSGILQRFDAKDGECLMQVEFKPGNNKAEYKYMRDSSSNWERWNTESDEYWAEKDKEAETLIFKDSRRTGCNGRWNRSN
jgi:predicted glutamine amidotransferase